MPSRIRYSQHALHRLLERGIARGWVNAVVGTSPTVYGRDQIFTLTAKELAARFGTGFAEGLRVVMDGARSRVVTVHWFGGAAGPLT
jgi:hypothetical protein